MHRGFEKLDPKWQMISASLRKGQLYVKMPVAKARAISMVWDILSKSFAMASTEKQEKIDALIKLITEEAVMSQTYGIASVFYMIPVDQCKEDIEIIDDVASEDQTGVFTLFKEALEKGLQSDPEVDWITRVGGPQAHPFEALQSEPEPVDVSFEDLFDFPDEPNA